MVGARSGEEVGIYQSHYARLVSFVSCVVCLFVETADVERCWRVKSGEGHGKDDYVCGGLYLWFEGEAGWRRLPCLVRLGHLRQTKRRC